MPNILNIKGISQNDTRSIETRSTGNQDSYLDFQLQSFGIEHCEKRKKKQGVYIGRNLVGDLIFEPLAASVHCSVKNHSSQFIEQYRFFVPLVVDKIENSLGTHV